MIFGDSFENLWTFVGFTMNHDSVVFRNVHSTDPLFAVFICGVVFQYIDT